MAIRACQNAAEGVNSVLPEGMESQFGIERQSGKSSSDSQLQHWGHLLSLISTKLLLEFGRKFVEVAHGLDNVHRWYSLVLRYGVGRRHPDTT